jgi:hypothetical protein
MILPEHGILDDASRHKLVNDPTGEDEVEVKALEDRDFLQMTQSAYDASTQYLDVNHREQWERNYANFMSRHPKGSKYYSDTYRFRNRLFRPKTRSNVRQKEAALSAAFFTTSDALNIQPTDTSDPVKVESARMVHETVNLRLKRTIPWFKIVIGAFQASNVAGVVFSHNYWEFEERVTRKTRKIPEYDEAKGQATLIDEEYEERETLVDRPVIELVEPENLLFAQGSDWLDPINSSPYIIHMIPMYVCDVVDKMQTEDSKTGQPIWRPISRDEIIAAGAHGAHGSDGESMRRARENKAGGQDPKESDSSIADHQIVWVYRVIWRFPGDGDYLWYTLGTTVMLTDPVPLKDVYLHGIRPYTMGGPIIEAFRCIPTSPVEMGQDIQAASNDLQNMRLDNLYQVLNKRYLVRRNGDVDLRALRRSIPGSITMVSDVDKDVKHDETRDITGSSYQEQHLFNADMDEISGSFSSSSVYSNRTLNETVGGMKMLKDPSNVMTEYMVMTFAQTWVKDTLTQLVALEKAYEDDEVFLAVAGKNANVNVIHPSWSRTDYDVEVNVGYGVTDPESRIRKFMMGVETVARMAPKTMSRFKEEEAVKEVMGILGYQDGSRFYMSEAEAQKLAAGQPPGPPDPKTAEIMMREKLGAADLELRRMIAEAEIMSRERIEAARLKAMMTDAQARKEIELGKQAVQVGKLHLDAFGLDYKMEDMRRKDAEIRDREQAKSRGGMPGLPKLGYGGGMPPASTPPQPGGGTQ